MIIKIKETPCSHQAYTFLLSLSVHLRFCPHPPNKQPQRRLDLQYRRTDGPNMHHEHISRPHRLLLQHSLQLAYHLHPVRTPLPQCKACQQQEPPKAHRPVHAAIQQASRAGNVAPQLRQLR